MVVTNKNPTMARRYQAVSRSVVRPDCGHLVNMVPIREFVPPCLASVHAPPVRWGVVLNPPKSAGEGSLIAEAREQGDFGKGLVSFREKLLGAFDAELD